MKCVIMLTMSIVFLLSLFCETSYGQLIWQVKTKDINLSIGEQSIETKFGFTNKGKYPVVIQSMHPGCGCTVVELEKRRYQPGESGEISVVYQIGDHTGLQRKKIIITTDDENAPTTVLTLNAHIPEVLRIIPNNLVWRGNELRLEKTVSIEVVHDNPVEILGVVLKYPEKRQIDSENHPDNLLTNQDGFEANIKVLEQGRKYTVSVTPPQHLDSDFLYAKLIVVTDFQVKDSKHEFTIPLNILPEREIKHRSQVISGSTPRGEARMPIKSDSFNDDE